PPAGIRHSRQNCNWQHKAITKLHQHGVNIDIEGVLSPDDYRIYKQVHGLPVTTPAANRRYF
ncbi:MAG: hypothetical protein OIF57_08175, partial [Marinobacterium sp.]|nr:hypothetical protein [Marinobacterium sp.]